MKNKVLTCLLCLLILVSTQVAIAQPYGRGTYDADVPYGNATTISISTSGTVNVNLTPSVSGVLGTGTDTVTVTSTDVMGYKLYIKDSDGNTNLAKGPDVIPASANGSPAALSNDTWGYNTDGSSNFKGITTSNVLLLDANGPYKSGNPTTVTYGVKATLAKPAGVYTNTVIYTVTPETD